MTFEKGQKVYFIYRVKAAHKNSHKWKVNEGIVLSDNGTNPKVNIKMVKGLLKTVKRKHIFVDLRCAESRCEYWNHWGRWKRIPPYYRAAYYASDENKPIIFADDYFKRKVQEDIKGFVNRALSGRLYITGNYQVLTPDIYALAQFAFGKRGDEVTGLLPNLPKILYTGSH